MRADNAAFAEKNAAAEKSPRFVWEQSYDSANTILRYFTSHNGTPVPAGAAVIQNCIKDVSATSQTLNPDTANARIGAIKIELRDIGAQVTDLFGGQLALGRSTRLQRGRLFVGYEGLTFNSLIDREFVLVQTQLVDEIAYDDGSYFIRCLDIQRELREDIFDVAVTNLQASLLIGQTTASVFDTSQFELLAHGTSYSDAPSATVGYFKIDQEVIRYTGKTATTFTTLTRGALNTVEADHLVDVAAPADRRTKVEEYVYLEMPAVKLVLALLTGVLEQQGGAQLPTGWHLGIPAEFVRNADFTGIGIDWYNPLDDSAGFPVRFEGLTKRKGKEFIEKELLRLLFAFMPVYADGALGLRRVPDLAPGAAYSAQLDNTNVRRTGELKHDFRRTHNKFQIAWNFEPSQKNTTRKNLLIDADSILVHNKAEPLELKFLGLHGSRHTAVTLQTRYDAMRDAFAGPPLALRAWLHLAQNPIEVGDVVRGIMPWIRDINPPHGPIDRSFAVHQIAATWDEGVSVKLFASTRRAKPVSATADLTVLTDAWYISEGTELSTVLTITGTAPGHISANGTLAGGADMNAAPSIFYYDGDLVLDAGVTVTFTGNVQLRVKGFLTVNGTLDGKGGGFAGAVSPGAVPSAVNLGTPGFLGTTVAGGAIVVLIFINDEAIGFATVPGAVVRGVNDVAPPLSLTWDGTTLGGFPADCRGSSGSSGGVSFKVFGGSGAAAGGAGGASGAGLIIVCRGTAEGAAGKIDVSGVDGAPGGFITSAGSRTYFSGAGAGGSPAACYIILDGAQQVVPSLTLATAVAVQGRGALPGGAQVLSVPSSKSKPPAGAYYSFYAGQLGIEAFPVADLSDGRGAFRVQFVPGNLLAVADMPAEILTPPTGMGLATGTAELLTMRDGTLAARIKVTWIASVDGRTRGYEIQFKKSADAIWTDIAPVAGINITTAWIIGAEDGNNYDVRIRAGDGLRSVSVFVTVTNFLVIGKIQAPSDVTGLVFTDGILTWDEIPDTDRKGYVVRHQDSGANDWNTALPGHGTAFITDNRFDSREIVGSLHRLLVKSIDTSRILSVGAMSLVVDLRPNHPNIFLVSRQPDGTREFTFETTVPSHDVAGVKIRFFLGTTSDWSVMTPLHEGVLAASPFESNQLAAGTYTFAVKNEDEAGNESALATFITTTIGDPRIKGAIVNQKEETAWTGTKTSAHVDVGTGWLVADGTATWLTLPATWAGWLEWNAIPVSPIIYQNQIDIGVIVPFVPLVTVIVDGTPTIEEQHSDDDITYTAFAATGQLITARFIRIRVTVAGTYPKIKTMRTILSGDPVTEIVEDIDTSLLTGAFRIGVGDFRVPITKTYLVIQTVRLTLQSVGAGWTWELIDKNVSPGPRLKIYNATPALADAVVDADVQGL